jgi:hypothetical protein
MNYSEKFVSLNEVLSTCCRMERTLFRTNLATWQSICRMDLPGPNTSVGTRTDCSVGPWDYPTCAARYLMA